MRGILVLALLLVPSLADAAISGYFSSVREIKAIVESEEVYHKLGSAYPIESMVRVRNGYVVSATINTGQLCNLKIRIKYTRDENDPFAPPKMSLTVGDRQCK
jgi:hypothetical protein